MASVPKKVASRFTEQVNRFQPVLKNALDRDINESDTVKIVIDMLANIFGYDQYTEVTSEYAIRSTFCDLAVKIGEEVKFLIEVKSINTDLKDNHLRQAVNYGANEGIQWVILTNGIIWRAYNIRLRKAVETEMIFEYNFMDVNARKKEDQEMLFLLAKEGISKDVMAEYQERVKSVNKYVIASILLQKPGLDMLRRELRRLTPGLKVEFHEIEDILKNEVLKRNVIEGDEANEAARKVKRALNKAAKAKSQ